MKQVKNYCMMLIMMQPAPFRKPRDNTTQGFRKNPYLQFAEKPGKFGVFQTRSPPILEKNHVNHLPFAGWFSDFICFQKFSNKKTTLNMSQVVKKNRCGLVVRITWIPPKSESFPTPAFQLMLSIVFTGLVGANHLHLMDLILLITIRTA